VSRSGASAGAATGGLQLLLQHARACRARKSKRPAAKR
jgi:hypothetical protein